MTLQKASVIRQPPSAVRTTASGILQRQCACGQHTVAGGECEECKRQREVGTLQRAKTNSAAIGAVPPIVHEVLRSPGQPLDAATRTFMEPRFGYDFSRVRVHTDAKAAESARAVNALAYTVGANVTFAEGQYQSTMEAGRRLLAHELTHVVQQRQAPAAVQAASLTVDTPGDRAEREADRVADALDGLDALPPSYDSLLGDPKLAQRCNQPMRVGAMGGGIQRTYGNYAVRCLLQGAQGSSPLALVQRKDDQPGWSDVATKALSRNNFPITHELHYEV